MVGEIGGDEEGETGEGGEGETGEAGVVSMEVWRHKILPGMQSFQLQMMKWKSNLLCLYLIYF